MKLKKKIKKKNQLEQNPHNLQGCKQVIGQQHCCLSVKVSATIA